MAETQSTDAQITKSHAGDNVVADKAPVFVVGSILKIDHPSENVYQVSQVEQQNHFVPIERSGTVQNIRIIIGPAEFNGTYDTSSGELDIRILVNGEFIGEFNGRRPISFTIHFHSSTGSGIIKFIWKTPSEIWAQVEFNPHSKLEPPFNDRGRLFP